MPTPNRDDDWTPLPLLTACMIERELPVRDVWLMPLGTICVRWARPWPDHFVFELAKYLAMSDDVRFVAPTYKVNGDR